MLARILGIGRALQADSDREQGIDVLDLCHDSVLDGPHRAAGRGVRKLSFVGGDCRVDLRVRGRDALIVEIRVRPRHGVVVEVRTKNGRGDGTVRSRFGRRVCVLKPGLTSFLARWPGTDRRAARTAWVLL